MKKTNETSPVTTNVICEAVSNQKRSEESLKKFREYQKQYMKQHYKQYSVRLNIDEDKEIIKYLDSLENYTDFIRKATAISKVIDSFN